jgi:hypothetical protein
VGLKEKVDRGVRLEAHDIEFLRKVLEDAGNALCVPYLGVRRLELPRSRSI